MATSALPPVGPSPVCRSGAIQKQLLRDARRVIDAEGKLVCPGFVDLHSHAGLTILGEPHHDLRVRQGETIELVGASCSSAEGFQVGPTPPIRISHQAMTYDVNDPAEMGVKLGEDS